VAIHITTTHHHHYKTFFIFDKVGCKTFLQLFAFQ
jgi:hypothetical protein